MVDDLDSTQKGIWILPYEPPSNGEDEDEDEAGPSRPRARPLKAVYDQSLRSYRDAHEAYETQRTEEQLDDIASWLERSSSSSISTPSDLGLAGQFHRLPVGILQHAGKTLHALLPSATERTEVVSIQGRDMGDLSSAMRIITSSLIPEVPGKKSGLPALDQVEQWWKARKDSPAILLHIRDAQIVPSAILAELMYCLSLHPTLPVRLLLSVPSTRTFLAQWTSLEPSSIDLTVLSAGRVRRRHQHQLALKGILETAGRVAAMGATTDLVNKPQSDEGMFGEGPEGALKQLHWSMLHHEFNSPLSTLAHDDPASAAGTVQAIVDSFKTDSGEFAPGRELLEIPLTRDLAHVNDPSPRISILHALANPSSYTHAPLPETGATPSRQRAGANGDSAQATDGALKELETLYGLWKGAGKSVNLWDWLQGFQGSLAADAEAEAHAEADGEVEADAGDEGEAAERSSSRKRPRPSDDATEQDRSHASFVRFCEEARMMGLVRAKGRKADEVIKSVTFV